MEPHSHPDRLNIKQQLWHVPLSHCEPRCSNFQFYLPHIPLPPEIWPGHKHILQLIPVALIHILPQSGYVLKSPDKEPSGSLQSLEAPLLPTPLITTASEQVVWKYL